jgi:hypothetical protein
MIPRLRAGFRGCRARSVRAKAMEAV